MKRKNRILALLLALTMLTGLCAMPVSAASEPHYYFDCSMESMDIGNTPAFLIVFTLFGPTEEALDTLIDSKTPTFYVVDANADILYDAAFSADSVFYSEGYGMYCTEKSVLLTEEGVFVLMALDSEGNHVAEHVLFENMTYAVLNIELLSELESYATMDFQGAPYTYFDDVPIDSWFCEYVNFAKEWGFVDGMTDTTFCPNNNLTCAQAIKLAACLHESFYGSGDPESYFADLPDTNPWYQKYVDYAKQHGIFTGFSDLNRNITRGEYVKLFCSAIDKADFDAINTVDDGAIPDVPTTNPNAGDIYFFYRAGIVEGSDAAYNFKPDKSITRAEICAILSRLCGFDLKEFTLTQQPV